MNQRKAAYIFFCHILDMPKEKGEPQGNPDEMQIGKDKIFC